MASKRGSNGARPEAGGPPTGKHGQGLIVGIGASAGGLDAFRAFLAAMPADSGMAFVLVQHLSPTHKSMLVEILGKSTTMKVAEAADGAAVAANHIYVIPPDATLTIEGGQLRVTSPAPPREHRRPIDTFFMSLAEDQGENAVCIVLAGTGSDGALGLSAVKEHGGLTIAQAEFDHQAKSGMPFSAAATGMVDAILPVEDMPARLLQHQRHLAQVSDRKGLDGVRKDAAEHLTTINALLRTRIGHDFSKYKEKTLSRRIQRRMQVLTIDDLPAYIARLRAEPSELDRLFREFLIVVTAFFRDPPAFEALGAALTGSLAGKGADDQVRIWVPGCATGEEAYSLAILVKEIFARNPGPAPRIQIFATDIDERAVAVARAGRYRSTAGLSPERLERWFSSEGDDHCPVKEIREICVFSTHSVVKDPPFSRLDLISCRNLLIYMDPALQDEVLRTFQYALKPSGLLFLGPSEGVTRATASFSPLDKKHRVFQRRDSARAFPNPQSPGTSPRAPEATSQVGPDGEDRIAERARHALQRHSPAWVVVDRNHTILRFSGGEAGRYLEPSSGAASLNLFSILRRSLRPVARTALRSAFSAMEPSVQDGVAIRIDGAMRTISVIVEPLSGVDGAADVCVVAFRDAGPRTRVGKAGEPERVDQALQDELNITKSQLQSTIDDLETANEEMKSASEEYQAVNEELQSMNEELETSKEEMQSINEELQTINAEMGAKNELLNHLNSDLKNLLDSTQIATIFLDKDLRIKTFTPGMTDIFHLREADRGRPITDIVSLLRYADLGRDMAKVMRQHTVVEREVQLADAGMTFIMRIRPYRTEKKVVDGVVMTFVDITARKQAEQQATLLMGELDHRVRNILAIVSSLIAQTLKSSPSPEAFAASMEGRITAIAAAHSLLTREGGKDEVSLRDLVATELAPYQQRGHDLEIVGPDVVLTPRAGLALALATHELASNAAKYGALSVPEGSLSVRWQISGFGSKQRLNIDWTESGGPAVEPPSHRGFGSRLIERGLRHEFDATVTRAFQPAGVRCAIDIPLTAELGRMRRMKEQKRGSR